MKKQLLPFLILLLASPMLKAQVSMPYVTGFDNAGEQSGWQQFRNGAISQFEEWEYDNAESFSGSSSLIHYYPVGGTDAADDWFVSPAFDITAGGALDSLRYYFNGFGTPQAGDTVFIYLLNGNADPDLASSAVILHEFSGANYQNDNTWRLLSPITLPAQPGNSYLAFRYKTINNWLDVRFDNVGLSRVSLAGIGEQETQAVKIYPNPAGQQVQLQLEAGQEFPLTFELYSTTGMLVKSAVISGDEIIDLSVAPGCYSYRINGHSTEPVTGKLVIQ